jgi:hypothetical protein
MGVLKIPAGSNSPQQMMKISADLSNKFAERNPTNLIPR